jgi:hypothetical protein
MGIRTSLFDTGNPIFFARFNINEIATDTLRLGQLSTPVVYSPSRFGEINPPDARADSVNLAMLVLDVH